MLDISKLSKRFTGAPWMRALSWIGTLDSNTSVPNQDGKILYCDFINSKAGGMCRVVNTKVDPVVLVAVVDFILRYTCSCKTPPAVTWGEGVCTLQTHGPLEGCNKNVRSRVAVARECHGALHMLLVKSPHRTVYVLTVY